MNMFLNTLRNRAAAGYPRTIIFPEAHDDRVLKAAQVLFKKRIANSVFVCNSDDLSRVRALGLVAVPMEEKRSNELETLLLKLRASKSGTKDALTPEAARHLARDPLFYGMYLLRCGEGDGLVAGAERTTAEVVRAGLWLVGKAKDIETVSSAFYMIVPPFRGTKTQEVLTFADCAVVPYPTAEQLADIAIASADARLSIVGDVPRVALLSYSTKGSGGDGSSIILVRKALELVRARKPKLIIDGELQADAALIKSVSYRKAPGNRIGGKANVLIFPTLDAANIAYKLVAQLVPEAQALGPVLQGLAKPVSDLSRGVRVGEVVDIATIVAAQSAKKI